MAKTPEGKLQKKCLDYVEDLTKKRFPILAINQHGGAYGPRGVPDILMCVRGKFIAVELKVNGNEPTPLQEHWLGKVERAMGRSYVCYTFDDFKKVVHHALY